MPHFSDGVDQTIDRLATLGFEAEPVTKEIINVSITANRGDCLSLLGIARELAGAMSLQLKLPETSDELPSKHLLELTVSDGAKDDILSDELLGLSGYVASDTPAELKKRLTIIGLQSKDLLIDISNLVAYEVGLPLHVFDREKIAAGLVVDRAESGETVTLLDGRSVSLQGGELIQRSEKTVVDLAGVMGAKNSAVSKNTSSVIVQAAAFSASSVRKNSRLTGVTTDASSKYVRGVDAASGELALRRFFYLATKYCPSISLDGLQSLTGRGHSPKTVAYEPNQIKRLLGFEPTSDDMKRLATIGFVLVKNTITVPSWRNDIGISADIADEIIRLRGYDNLPDVALSKKSAPTSQYQQILELKRKLSRASYTEMLTGTFARKGALGISNATSNELKYLRSNLAEPLAGVVAKNPFIGRLYLYEIGQVFTPKEDQHLAIVLSGLKERALAAEATKMSTLLGRQVEFKPFRPDDLREFGIKHDRVVFWESSMAKVKLPSPITPARISPLPQYRPISKFPPVVRDVTLAVDTDVDNLIALNYFDSADGVLFAELTDEYRHEETPQKKSVTYRIVFQNIDRTLTDSEANNLFSALLEGLSPKLSFEIL